MSNVLGVIAFIVFILCVIAVAAGITWAVVKISPSRKPKEESVLYLKCPGCKRKLKYLARQAGHRGMCNNCKEQFTFPLPGVARPYTSGGRI